MATFDFLIRKGSRIFRSKYIRYLLIILALFFIYSSLMRACSANNKLSTYRVGRSNRLMIADVMNKERNILAFSDHLLAEIGNIENLRFNIFATAQEELLDRLRSGQFDAILTPLQPDFQQERALSFSQPYLLLGPVLVVVQNSELDTWDEIRHKIIGVPSQLSSILELTQNSDIQMRLYDNNLKALSDLNERHIDGVILPAFSAYIYARTFYPNRLKIATTPLTNEGFRLVTLKNEKGQALIEAFNRGLDALKQNGTYDQLIENWGLFNPEKLD